MTVLLAFPALWLRERELEVEALVEGDCRIEGNALLAFESLYQLGGA